MRLTGLPLALLAVLALLVAGCGGDADEAPPAERAREGLEQAEHSIEQLESEYEQLGDQIEEREQLIREHMETQLRLIDIQLNRFRQETDHLPAEVETTMRDKLEELATRRAQVQESMNAYLQAGAEQAPPLREQFEQQLSQLQQETEAFESQLMEARERASGTAE